jgi:hypothetical protein
MINFLFRLDLGYFIGGGGTFTINCSLVEKSYLLSPGFSDAELEQMTTFASLGIAGTVCHMSRNNPIGFTHQTISM